MYAKHATLTALVALTLLTAACQEKTAEGTADGPGGGPGAGGPVSVAVVTVEPRDLPLSTTLSGRATAYRVAEVRPQVTGIVQRRLFEEGSDVAAGQQLYQIDPATYQAAVRSAEADLAKAEANLKSVQAKATRYADLVKINAVSRQDYDDVVASLDQAKAEIMVARAAVETARINLDFTRVYAPISGRIATSAVTEGALVTANQTEAMTTITQLDPIHVDLNQSGEELKRFRRENKEGAAPVVRLLSDDDGAPHGPAGVLKFTDVTVDPSTGSVRVRAEFPNPDKLLLPGMFVRARVEEGVAKGAILVPQPALVRHPDGSATVWVVDAERKVDSRPVKVGAAVGGDWRIESGLKPGDSVVVSGLQKIQPGAVVDPVAAASTLAERP